MYKETVAESLFLGSPIFCIIKYINAILTYRHFQFSSSLIDFLIFTYFLNSYQKVIHSTSFWVLTGGINKGLTKYIGEALKETTGKHQSDGKHAMCVGITPWNNVPNRKELLGTHSGEENIINIGDAYLDNNHTHFFLVDNNYAENHDNPIEFSASLVTMMRKLQYEGTIFFLHTSVFLKIFVVRFTSLGIS